MRIRHWIEIQHDIDEYRRALKAEAAKTGSGGRRGRRR